MSFGNEFDRLGKHRQTVITIIKNVRAARKENPQVTAFNISAGLSKKAIAYLEKKLQQEHQTTITITMT